MPVKLNIKILLVEDAAVMRKMEKKVLSSLGHENIIESVDGDDAIAKLQSDSTIELVISDWNMPNKSGLELLRWIRSNDQLKNLPFIMATGRGEKKEVTEANEAGVSAFISKPFNAAELKEKIDEAFGDKKEEMKERPKAKLNDEGKVIINMAHIQITDHLVLGVLKHLIKIGEINPKHFELRTHRMSSWNPVANALDKGTVEGACVLAPIAMDLYKYGAPLKLILFAHRNGSILVRNKKGGDFREPYNDFFKQKTFYIPHTLSIHNMLAHMFFTGIGLQPGVAGNDNVDIEFEVVPPVKMPEFLGDNPDTAGYLVAEPLGTKAIANGLAELQFLSSEMWENHPCCVITMQEEFLNDYPDAAFELSDYLVKAGKFIAQKPGAAAEIAVEFLDPDKSLGLKVPLLRNVLTEPLGIKTDNLYPSIEDLDKMQHYMHDVMGVGSIIEVDKFVDLKYARSVCGESASRSKSNLHDSFEYANELLVRAELSNEELASKALLNMEGQYLMFVLDNQEFGIDILKIREIIKLVPITSMPQSPPFVKGIIDLRGNVVPIIDIRTRFGMPEVEPTNKTCIIVLEIEHQGISVEMGIIVDSVSEVRTISASDIDAPPEISTTVDSKYIMAMIKDEDMIKILLDISLVLSKNELALVNTVA